MGEINIPRDQQSALKAIDTGELDRLIEQAIREDRTGDLHRLSLTSCGSYVATELHSLEQALAKHRLAKSARKREETGNTLRRAGRDLSFAVNAMKRRMETEQEEGQLFQIDDQVMPPYRFSKHMSVRVGYRGAGLSRTNGNGAASRSSMMSICAPTIRSRLPSGSRVPPSRSRISNISFLRFGSI